MSFLNGLKNIKIILIISLLSLSLLSFLLFYNFFEKKEFVVNTDCNPTKSFHLERYYKNVYNEFIKVCNDTQNYKNFNATFEGNGGGRQGLETHFYNFKFDNDSASYFENLYRLNKSTFSARKILSELNKSEKDLNNLITEYRKQGKLNFDNRNEYRDQFKNSQFVLLNDFEQFVLVHFNFSETQIKHHFLLDYYSFIYTKIFDNNDHVYQYVILLNFITLLFLSIFFYKIIKILFPSFSQILNLLVISNVVMCPVTIIYFLTFYKEPLIILSITMIIFNYVYFLTKKINLFRFIYCTFIVIISFFIIRHVKYEYTIIYAASFLLSIIILNLYKKNRIFFSICFAQCIILIFFISLVPSDFNLEVTKQRVENVYQKTLFRAENVYQNILYLKYSLKINDVVKNDVVKIDSSEYDKLENQLIDLGILDEKLSTLDKELIIEEMKPELLKKEVNLPKLKKILLYKIRDRVQKKKISLIEKKNINTRKTELISDFNYYTPEIKLSEREIYIQLECFDFIKISHCKKINNFSFRLFSIKKATLWENDYFKSVPNENIVNASLSYSAIKMFTQIPISAVRGYFMPILLNSNKVVNLFTVFKLIGCFLLIYICYFYYKNKPIKYFLIIFGTVIIFLPLVTAVDLVTSNYFTYLRYVYPFNIFLLLIVYSFIVNQILELKND